MNMKNLIKEWAESIESEKECLSENKTGMTNFEYGTTVWKNEYCKDCSDSDALLMWFNASEGPKNPDKSVDDYSISELFGWLVKPAEQQDEIEESSYYDKARKIGYRGDDNQEKIEEWLKGDYAKWKQHCLDVFMNIAKGDEEKAIGWFRIYNRLASDMVGMSQWDSNLNKYVDQKDVKKNLENELGDSPEVKELMDKLEEKWAKDTKSLLDFYDNSRYTGD